MLTAKHISAEDLHETLRNIKVGGTVCHFSLKKCEELVPKINEINELKEKKNAVILVHSYVSPEIIYGVGDYVGDSYALSKNALETTASTIVFSAVRFMGETAKILNPEKDVLLPGTLDGCTLADAITAEQVRELRKKFPDYTFVCYINTTAEVKAECDVCVTSANVYKVVTNIPNEKIYFLPDKMMGQNLAMEMERRGIKKDIRYYNGTCTVHEEYELDQVFRIRTEYPKVKVVSHPECKPEVCEESDFVGSTAQMLDYMMETTSQEFLMLTECGLSARLQKEFPNKKLVGTCTLCPYMKSNTLDDILRVLKNPAPKDYVHINPGIIKNAKKCIEAMFQYTEA